MKLKASIGSNDRKYYGTVIELENEDGGTAEIQVWINGISPDYAPSEREYDLKGSDGKYYARDEDGTLWEYEISDNHYETQTAYEICKKIVETLDGMEI